MLADRITWFMQRLGMPNGLRAIGYTSADIPALVEGTLPQHRVTKLSPRPAGPKELAGCSKTRWSRGEVTAHQSRPIAQAALARA